MAVGFDILSHFQFGLDIAPPNVFKDAGYRIVPTGFAQAQRRTQDFVLGGGGGLKENFTLTNQLGLVCICTYVCNFGLYVCIIMYGWIFPLGTW